MIVRIMGEGQLEVDESHLDELNQLDERLTAAVEADDDPEFRTALEALLAGVRSYGRPLPDDALVDSDLVLPFPEAHITEVREMLAETAGEGLIPG
ncbi:MAG TPA: hypothetical protein VK894_09645 [Jiangellales bacterium]|nr:hypothetical protein [Jiangellales bacterium]